MSDESELKMKLQMRWMIGLWSCLLGCATAPQVESLSTFEVQQMSQDIGTGLAQQFEKRLTFIREPAVSIYLVEMGNRMMMRQVDLQGAELTVRLIRAQSKVESCYALSGVTIYCPIELLKSMNTDNEVAAVLAIQLAHILNHDFLTRLEKALHLSQEAQALKEHHPLEPKDTQKIPNYRALWMNSDTMVPFFFGQSGLFSFSKEAHLRALRRAVQIMYQAGYDPRGLVQLFDYYTQIGKRAPYSVHFLEQGMEAIRQEISKYVPLKNPIVRTPAFYQMKKKVASL